MSTNRDVDHALAYPEPPASSLWHRHGGMQTRPLTDAQKKRNRELLLLAQHTARPRTPRRTNTLTETT
ncbi:hypothetical protein OHB41_49760 [Streptomyces sp. NBC_01571]|uniref:hypothetical protein n=1 Tax=Streptomyces sp. NBC_01571 TaxID=2975883 RepID=UPI0022523C04|nr:hypothetical protein [Streptomyces sp. NBC_01571]MCX4581050.1 hypothetical protein [Streptomyces sp. NBC_01571]